MRAVPARAWLLLAATVASEVVGTVSLRLSHGFTIWWAAAIAISGYLAAVVLLSRVLQYLPMSLTYVIWTGAGTVGVLALSIVLLGDRMTPVGWAGVTLVVIGVIVINARPRRPRGAVRAGEESDGGA